MTNQPMTPEQLQEIQSALRRTWQMIGGEMLSMGPMSRKAVVEVVLDASHLEHYGQKPEAVKALRALPPKAQDKLAREVFTSSRYSY